MRAYDIIDKKKRGHELSKEEITFIIDGYLKGEIPDYQVSALLMAIYFNGMKDDELSELTFIMRDSGDIIDMSRIKGVVVDKHSTGGVGDKTTLIVAAIAASRGVKICKMSGRGLGHTGGTVDKMESIPGFKTEIDPEEVFQIVNKIGVSIVGQSGNLAPADKKIYALRDVTATVDSIPLIAASIMSKKLAAGSDAIVLDVKMGSGAFMKNIEDAKSLARHMVDIGTAAKKNTVALITNMDVPLGEAVGNRNEIVEVVNTLRGSGPKDLEIICLELAAQMIYLAGIEDLKTARENAAKSLKDMSAYNKFIELVKIQGGDITVFDDLKAFSKAEYEREIKVEKTGVITSMDTESIGLAASLLGAGRTKLDDVLDFTAGVNVYKKTGDSVDIGDTIATIHTSDASRLDESKRVLLEAYSFDGELVEYPMIIETIGSK